MVQENQNGITNGNKFNPYDYSINLQNNSPLINKPFASSLSNAFDMLELLDNNDRKLLNKALESMCEKNIVLQRKIESNLSLASQFEDLRTRRVTGGIIPSLELSQRVVDWRYLAFPDIERKILGSSPEGLMGGQLMEQYKRDTDNFYDQRLNQVLVLDKCVENFKMFLSFEKR
jgi:hypothetical protein